MLLMFKEVVMINCESCPTNDKCLKDKEKCLVENNYLNEIKTVIGIASGKGGVGKSSLTVLIAKSLRKKGYSVGILDADISGPSIPRLLNVEKERISTESDLLVPVVSKDMIKVVSLNLLTENEAQPVIWRGPILSNMVKQFWTNVLWGELDYLLIDMPPGTTDIAITVMQEIPINGIVFISVPQDLVSMVVSKSINMAKKMGIDVIGVIENMSYLVCPDCHKQIRLFNSNNIDEFLKAMEIPLLGEIPMLSSISNLNSNNTYPDKDIDPIINKILAII